MMLILQFMENSLASSDSLTTNRLQPSKANKSIGVANSSNMREAGTVNRDTGQKKVRKDTKSITNNRRTKMTNHDDLSYIWILFQ